jgi:hypothetical protein
MEDDGPSDSTGRLRLLRRGCGEDSDDLESRTRHEPREALQATHGRSDAIEAAALAAALAESALESESEDKAGPWGQFTPSHLCDFEHLYDPDCGSDDDLDNPHGDWLDFG